MLAAQLSGVAIHADVDPALIAGEVEHPIGDRVPEILVLEVVRADQRGLPVAPARPTALKSPISSRFLESTLITGSPLSRR